MKRWISMLLALTMLLSLCACTARSGGAAAGQEPVSVPEAQAEEPAVAQEPETEQQPEKKSETELPEQTAEQTQPEEQPAEPAQKSALVIFFSSANTTDADVVSAATPYAGDVSVTEALAQMICSQVDGDLVRLTPVTDYPVSYNATLDAAKTERDEDQRPAYQDLGVDPESYDTIFVGYPMWWYTLPMLFYSFFEDYDFSGKTIVPFNTHAGSRDGGTYQTIAEWEPDATVLDGLAVSGTSVGDGTEQTVKDWLERLGFAAD